MILIVGGESQIGAALIAEAERRDEAWRATTRQEGCAKREGWLRLDLSEDAVEWQLPKVDIAFLCAAVTKLQACEDDPERTRRINVDATVELARRLAVRGTFIVFLSTNLVFDGEEGFVRADAVKNPQCEYGRQKAEAEEGIVRATEGYCAVVRLTKVVGPTFPLLEKWKGQLLAGEDIEAFEDLMMAPIGIDWVAKGIMKIGMKRRGGVFQMSANAEISFADVAKELARRIGVVEGNVRRISARVSGHPFVPKHASLGMGELETQYELVSPSPWIAWDSVGIF